jgi:hypothetical protein
MNDANKAQQIPISRMAEQLADFPQDATHAGALVEGPDRRGPLGHPVIQCEGCGYEQEDLGLGARCANCDARLQ